MIEEEGQQTDRIAQIVQVRRVRRRTPKDETHWRPLHGISEWPVRAQQLVPGVPLSKIIQDIGMRGTGIAGELQPGHNSLRSVRRTRQASATVYVAEDDIEEEGLASSGRERRAQPRIQFCSHLS